jgi:carboxymethylenebutenolidase
MAGSLATAYLVAGSGASPRALRSAPKPQAADNADVQTVRYESGGASIEAYLAKPKGAGRQSAVIVVHDNQGLTQDVQDVSRRFAEAGFVALAPNLLSRSVGAVAPERAPIAITQLPIYQPIDDLRAAFAYLQQEPDVDAAKISSVGFGWGGWRVYKMAAEMPTLYRAVVFYGVAPTDGSLADVKAPVLALYAQRDFQVTGNVVWTQKQLGEKFTYSIYPNTVHGFFATGGTMPSGGSPYNADAAKQAWTKTLEFLRL